jgi:hypothetical protein
MRKFVPFEKLSKRKQREQNARRRGTWNGLNPVTRKPNNPKVYQRKKTRSWEEELLRDRVFFYCCDGCSCGGETGKRIETVVPVPSSLSRLIFAW